MHSWDEIQQAPEHAFLYDYPRRCVLASGPSEWLQKRAKAAPLPDPSCQESFRSRRAAHAAKVIDTIRETLRELESLSEPKLASVLNLAVIEEYLSFLQAETGADLSECQTALEPLQARAHELAEKWQSVQIVSRNPSEHLKQFLPALVEILNKARSLANERLFVPPDLEGRMAQERSELAPKVSELKRREQELLEAFKLVSEKLATAAPSPAAKSELEAKQHGLSERAAELLQDWNALEAEVQTRQSAYGGKSCVGLLDARRKPLMPGFDKQNIDTEQLKGQKASLAAKAKLLDDELQRLERKLPDVCRDPGHRTINQLFWVLNNLWRLSAKKEHQPALEQKELYEFVFREGPLYFEICRELREANEFFQAIVDDHDRQNKAVQEIRDLIKQGNVFTAEKRLSKVERKFKDINCRRLEETLSEATRLHRAAKQLASEADDYVAKHSNLLGKLFKDKTTRQRLENQLASLRSDINPLPKCELKSAVGELCQKIESTFRA